MKIKTYTFIIENSIPGLEMGWQLDRLIADGLESGGIEAKRVDEGAFELRTKVSQAEVDIPTKEAVKSQELGIVSILKKSREKSTPRQTAVVENPTPKQRLQILTGRRKEARVNILNKFRLRTPRFVNYPPQGI